MTTVAIDEKKPATEALAIREREPQALSRPASFAPTTFDDALKFSDMVAKSDLAPKDFKGKPANVFIAIQMGAEVGLSPIQAIQNIAVINGRPSLWGDAALAVVQAHKDYEWHHESIEGEGDKMIAICKIKRKGHPEYESRFSIDDAKVAKLWGKKGYEGKDTPWITSPKRMLQMRARGFAIRDKFADALRGVNIAEEAMDIPPEDTPTAPVLQAAPVVDDPEKALREECDKLMAEDGMNAANRQAKLGQYAGKLPELKTRILDHRKAKEAAKAPSTNTPAHTTTTPAAPSAQSSPQPGFNF
ncbi:MAG: hypothetical protein ACRD3E_15855 [Terriglobales bacterium]